MAFLVAGGIPAGGVLAAQEVEEIDESGIALLRGAPAWKVTEKAGNERWDATWTLRSDGKTFDGHWVHQPGGDSGELRGFAKIASLRGSTIVIDRPGLGRYTGAVSSDRTRITGRMSWTSGTWEARLEAGALPGTGGGTAAGGGSGRPAGGGAASPGSTPSGTARSSLAGQTWHVIETVGNERWTAEWNVRSDGRSFDATWVHSPGGDKGRLTNFARIISIAGNQITINRPGLGTYTGTVSADRRSIRGKMSWSAGTWTVTLSNTKLPTALP